MYLGILVLLCVALNLGHINGEPFQCPICSAGGKDALADCDDKIMYQNCDYENPRCEVNKYKFKSGSVRVNRLCTSKEMYEAQIAQCKNYRNCPLRGYCTESECMATLPEPFQCPICSAGGKDALADCDDKIMYQNCDYENPRCEVNKYEFKSGSVRVNRLCTSKEMYEAQIAQCKNYRNCPLRGYCTESECMATLPVPMPFSCPVCEGAGENAESDCENSIRMKVCNTHSGQPIKDPVCAFAKMNDGSYFERSCSSREDFKDVKSDCEEYGDCTVVKCEESKCKAEFPGSE